MFIQKLKTELMEVAKLEFKTMNSEQKRMLRKDYNFITGGFQYAQNEWDDVIFICNNDTFRNMEHYLGLEYERDNIGLSLSDGQQTLVEYNFSERIEELYNKLKELE